MTDPQTGLRIALPLWLVLAPLADARAQDEAALTLQREAQRQFDLLTQRLQRLATVEGRDQAVLESGNRFVQDRAVGDAMREIESLIEERRYDEALRRIRTMRSELTSLLDLLLGRDQEVEDLAAEIERLQNYRKKVRELAEEQQAEVERAERSAALARLNAQIGEALERLLTLRNAQDSMRDPVDPDPDDPDDLVAKQEMLGQAATDLEPRARRIETSAKELELLPAADSSLLEAATQLADRTNAVTDRLRSDPTTAEAAIEAAVAEADGLRQQLESLRSAVEEAARNDSTASQQADQAKTAAETRELAERMKQDEDRAAESGDTRHTPGREDLEAAIPEQESALEELGKDRSQAASQEQREALERLENAEQQLDEALEQLKEQQQEEILRNLEAEFTEMLNAQRELTRRTRSARELARDFDGELPTGLSTRSQDIATGERELERRAKTALKTIEQDGSSTVLPRLVALIADDLAAIAARLEQTPTTSSAFGRSTTDRQVQVESTLEDLVEALRQEIEDNESGEPSESEGEPELMPKTAELKLVLIQQKRINRNTRELHEAGAGAGEGDARSGQLADRQTRVAELLAEVAARLDEEQRAREERARSGGSRRGGGR